MPSTDSPVDQKDIPQGRTRQTPLEDATARSRNLLHPYNGAHHAVFTRIISLRRPAYQPAVNICPVNHAHFRRPCPGMSSPLLASHRTLPARRTYPREFHFFIKVKPFE